jgi:hypothetical protein
VSVVGGPAMLQRKIVGRPAVVDDLLKRAVVTDDMVFFNRAHRAGSRFFAGGCVMSHACCRNVNLVGSKPGGVSAFVPKLPARGVCSYQILCVANTIKPIVPTQLMLSHRWPHLTEVVA